MSIPRINKDTYRIKTRYPKDEDYIQVVERGIPVMHTHNHHVKDRDVTLFKYGTCTARQEIHIHS
jgi:hypothetical protein